MKKIWITLACCLLLLTACHAETEDRVSGNGEVNSPQITTVEKSTTVTLPIITTSQVTETSDTTTQVQTEASTEEVTTRGQLHLPKDEF